VSEENFGLGDEGTVDPVLGGGAAGLADDSAKVALGEAHAVGVIGNLVVLAAVLVDELNEAIEDSLLARASGGEVVGLLMEQAVVVVHQGSDKARGRGAMVVWLVDEVPKGVEDVAGCLQILIAYGQLKVAQLSIKCRRELTNCERHREVCKEADALYFKVIRKADGMDDGARTNIYECTSREVTIYKVEVDVALAACYHTQAVVVDDEGWLLLHDKTEHQRVAVNHRQFVAEEYVLADLREVVCKDVAHSRHVHQFRLLCSHNTIYF